MSFMSLFNRALTKWNAILEAAGKKRTAQTLADAATEVFAWMAKEATKAQPLMPDEVQDLIHLVQSQGIDDDDLWRAKHDLKFKYGDDETRWSSQDPLVIYARNIETRNAKWQVILAKLEAL